MFVQARNYTPTYRDTRPIRVFVVHDMEAPEKGDTAESVAAYFAGSNAPQASAHYCIDSNSVVQCVRDSDVAWAAPNANHDGLHFEHAGYASQIMKDWLDPFGKRCSRRARRSSPLSARSMTSLPSSSRPRRFTRT
jgi:hypothetical protein